MSCQPAPFEVGESDLLRDLACEVYVRGRRGARAEGQRRNTLTPAETVVGVRGVAADAVGQSVASLRTKLVRALPRPS